MLHLNKDIFSAALDASPQLADQYAGERVPAFGGISRGTVVGAMSGSIEEGLVKERIQKIFRNS